MSQVAIAGNLLGAGILTIAAPNTASSYTLTLPQISGTIVSTNSSGNVGIGVTPYSRLHVTDASQSNGTITLGSSLPTTGYYSQIYQNGNNLDLIANGDQAYRVSLATNNGSGNLRFFTASGTTGNTERMRIDSSGNVLIGATSFSYTGKLNLSGSQYMTGGSIENWAGGYNLYNTTTNYIGMGFYKGTAAITGSTRQAVVECQIDTKLNIKTDAAIPIVFVTNSNEAARITAAGGLGLGTANDPGAGAIYATGNITAFYSSDAKFKENIQPITGACETIRAIGGDYFNWTDEYIAKFGGVDGYFLQKEDFGVIAQKVQRVFPKAVRTRPDGTLAVDYEKLGILAFPAIIEILDRLDTLEAKVGP